MGRFIKWIAFLLLLPVFLLAVVYFVTDPYKTLRPFSLDYFDSTNRDYLSSELFVQNYPTQQYDSYVFASSRGCGINTYHWKKYLPEGANQFLFQAWSETITGIDQKITYIDEHRYALNNALILIDIPGSFSQKQLPIKALSIKDPRFSNQPRWVHQTLLLFNFIQKPSEWLRTVKKWIHPQLPYIDFDVISNDWEKNNRNVDLNCIPGKDSLKNLSHIARNAFFKNYVENPDIVLPQSKSLIDESMVRKMTHIREVFNRHNTKFQVIITPGYCYQYPSISNRDLEILQSIFGDKNVFDFSRRRELTSDYNNFSDPNHFGLRIGWLMLEEVYNPNSNRSN